MKYSKHAVIVILMAALVGGYYYYLSHRNPKAADDVELTQLDEVLLKQLDNAYPPTPREVVRFYNKFIECAYGGEYDDTQFNGLVDQARKLMDEELLGINPLEDYKSKLQEEIASYKEDKKQIIKTSVCASDEVILKEIEGKECAYVQASYFLKEGNGKFSRTYQRYLLRKDPDENWKILTFYLAGGAEEE